MGISFAGLSGGGGKAPVIKRITSTQAWTAPDDVDTVEVELIGGGGSGMPFLTNNVSGSSLQSHTGGGAGGYVRKVVSVTPGASYTITIGAGGAGNNSGINNGDSFTWHGNPGQDSKFGNLLTAYRGSPGTVVGSNNSSFLNQAPFGSIGGSGQFIENVPNSNSVNGGGGGAGSPAVGHTDSGNSNIGGFLSGRSPQGATRHLAIQGHVGGQATNNDSSWQGLGGKPINGLGAGGSASSYTNNTSSAMYNQALSQSGIGGRGATPNINAGSGEINTGSGGGAGMRASNTFRGSGSGGSGVCILRYTTAGE